VTEHDILPIGLYLLGRQPPQQGRLDARTALVKLRYSEMPGASSFGGEAIGPILFSIDAYGPAQSIDLAESISQ
jgi:hypothetical protein